MQKFVIFGRKVFDQPLEKIASIKAPGAVEAKTEALNQFSEKEWLEMISIPRSEMLHIVESGRKK